MASAEEGSGNVSAVTQKSVVTAIRPKLVIPGESLEQELDSIEQRVRVGAGIQQHDGQVIASKAGVLRHQKPNRVWVEQSSRRVRCSILACCSEACSLDCYVQYIAKQEDPVIGVVVDMDRHAEGSYRISLHGTCDALLHKLAFDGASKKNKPDLQIGSAVYCRIASASKFVEPQLSCQVLSGPKKDWVTGEALFGELKGGLVTRCSSGLANNLLDPDHVVLNALGKRLPFELAVGLNGLFWVNAAEPQHVVVIVNAILNSEFLSVSESSSMVEQLLKRIA